MVFLTFRAFLAFVTRGTGCFSHSLRGGIQGKNGPKSSIYCLVFLDEIERSDDRVLERLNPSSALPTEETVHRHQPFGY
jgi:hypothetical protein